MPTPDDVMRLLRKRYGKRGRDFTFKSSHVARDMGINSYLAYRLLAGLWLDDLIEKTSPVFQDPIIWKTCFGRGEA